MFYSVLIADPKRHAQEAMANEREEILHALNNRCFVDRIVPQRDFRLCVDNIKFEILESMKYLSSLNCHQVVDEVVSCCGGEKISGYLIFSRYLDLVSNQIRLFDFPLEPICVDEFAHERIADLKKIGNESEAKKYLISTSVMEPENEGKYVRFRLNHHSVVLDNCKKYIECLHEKYPTAKENSEINYLFIPHASGALGFSLDAYFQV